MKTKTYAGIVVAFVAVLVLGQPVSMIYHHLVGYHEVGTLYAKRTVKAISEVKKVDKVLIELDLNEHGQFVTLTVPKDTPYIDALMRSLRRVAVVDEAYPWAGRSGGDEIVMFGVGRNGPGSRARIEGRFDPARAPIVSSFLRSDDLGKVVYSIFRAKGIEPRSGRK